MSSSLQFRVSVLRFSVVLVPILLSCFIILLHRPPSTLAASITLSGNDTDRLALLAIKSQITQDPLGFFSSWNDSLHFCSWKGVTCGHLHQRVVSLNLSNYNLVGSLSPHVGNLSFLRGLNLQQNYFHGGIPPEVDRLYRLKYLNFSNNSFSGEIPANLSSCSSLIMLRLGFNNLTGKIPSQLGSLQKLERFQLHYNHLSGQLPDSLGNLSSIRSFSMSVNGFEGTIPESLGRLKTLNFLGFGLNQLSGIIPDSLFNVSSTLVFTLPFNQFHGNLPSNLGFTLPNLQVLNIGHNHFTGSLPQSLSNASNLVEFDINASNFTGKVKIDFGGLPGLWSLVLAANQLGTGEADDLSFLDSLTKCRNLQLLDLSNNGFGGELPHSIGNLSTQLVQLRLDENQLSGSIPFEIENLVNLTELTMYKNNLSGSIQVIGNLPRLQRLDLSENAFSGFIPSSLGNITRLYTLHLEKNHLMGNIPSTFENLHYLQDLDLSQNNLEGYIPKEVMGLSSLTISLNLAKNKFTGALPSETGNLKNLGRLDLSDNKLSDNIPTSLGSCMALEYLHMKGNFFRGTIPSSFSSLRGLRDLDLSHNNLSGQIPEFLQRLSLTNLNLSLNSFNGEVPAGGIFKNATAISVAGNDRLCGGIPALKLPPCSHSDSKKGKFSGRLKLIIPLLSALLGLVLITSLLIILWLRKSKRVPSADSSSTKKDLLLSVSYEDLLKATDGFSSANLIGSGSFGSVYKGLLSSNKTIVAVKVVYLHQRGALKSFMAECEALRNIRHRNLVKILTACSSIDFQGNDFKALVYEFMANGSLESWLHPDPYAHHMTDTPKILSLLQRLNIAIDVASAMEYLHHQCHKPIVHCDLKPSNVLLDINMTAHVGDFGLTRFIPEATNRSCSNQSSSIGLKGTVGYAAPEYGMGSQVSTYGDVYSYGILLLEMFTGKRPTDEMFKDGLDLHNFVKTGLPEIISEILDPMFVSVGEEEEERAEPDIKKEKIQESLISILKIGVGCSLESPRERMDIAGVVKSLLKLRSSLLAYGIS